MHGRLKGSRLATVDDDAGACDPARPWTAEEGDDLANLFSRAESAERDLAANELRDFLRVGAQPSLPRATGVQDASRRDGQCADSAWSEVVRLLVRQADERCLGDVVAHRSAALPPPNAGDVQDDAL